MRQKAIFLFIACALRVLIISHFKVVLPYLVNFGPFLTNFVHQIGKKTEKNSDKILLAYHFYGPSIFLNIKVFIILHVSTSKKFYILPKWSYNQYFRHTCLY